MKCRSKWIESLVLAIVVAAGTGLASAADESTLSAGHRDAAGASTADEWELSAGAGINYTSGKYGGTDTTRLWYLPFSIYLDKGDWGYDLTLPYLFESGPTGQTVVAGRVVARGSVAASSGGASAQIANVSGMGDVVAGVTRFFGGTNDGDALLFARFQTKFGTADADKGLGTGKNDYSVRLGAAKPYGNLTLSGELGYTHYGSSPEVPLKNALFGVIDGSYRVGELSRVGASLYISQTIVTGSSAPQDVSVYWKYKATKATSVRVYLLKGLSDGSADYGLGLSALISF